MTDQKQFEIEYWYNYTGSNNILRWAKGFLRVLIIFPLIIGAAIGIYMIIPLAILRYIVFGFSIAFLIVPFFPLISYLQRNRKAPSYGLTKEGLFINERGWNSIFFKWDEIEALKVNNHPKFGNELYIKFKCFEDMMSKQDEKYRQNIEKEHVWSKCPVKLSSELTKEPVDDLVFQAMQYFEIHKRQTNHETPEVFEPEIQSYLDKYALDGDLNLTKSEKVIDFDDFYGDPYWLVPLKNNTEKYEKLAFSPVKKEVMYLLDASGKKWYPHI